MSTDLDKLNAFLRDDVGYEGELDPDIDLLDKRILDSFSVVEMASFIQANFEIELEAEDLTRDNFTSLSNMVALIDKRKSA